MSKEKKAQEEEVTSDVKDGASDESADAAKIDIEFEDAPAEVEVSEEGEPEPPTDADAEEALVAEVAALKDQLLRKQADFENFRKRMIRDREDAVRYANANLLLDLVEIIDNFERAIKSSQDSTDFGTFHEGVEMIEKQFTGMLDSKYGLKRFESVGEEFDPEKHEAIAAVESEDVETQMVLDDFQKGYMLHDRVLRHAKVRVAMPKNQEQDAEE